MAQHIEQKLLVNISADKLWAVLNDFGGIDRYSPTIQNSPLIGDQNSGLGAKRKCEFYEGGSVVEEIIDCKDG